MSKGMFSTHNLFGENSLFHKAVVPLQSAASLIPGVGSSISAAIGSVDKKQAQKDAEAKIAVAKAQFGGSTRQSIGGVLESSVTEFKAKTAGIGFLPIAVIGFILYLVLKK